LDNCLKVGDWVIIDGKVMGEIWYIHTPNYIIDVRIDWGEGQDCSFETVRTNHHELTKVVKEVADIMRGV